MEKIRYIIIVQFAIIICCFSAEEQKLFYNMRSYVAGQLEFVETNSVLINDYEKKLFPSSNNVSFIVDRMHVNDANRHEFLVQAKSVKSSTQRVFCRINRITTQTKCENIDDFISIDSQSTIALAAYIESVVGEPKIAGCYETVAANSATLTCFVGNYEVGKWNNVHLSGLRYLPQNNTIEAIVMGPQSVCITHAKDYFELLPCNNHTLIDIAFLKQNQLALALSDDERQTQVFVCNLSPDRLHTNCTSASQRIGGGSGRLGFVAPTDAQQSDDDYKFLLFTQSGIFSSDEMVVIRNSQQTNASESVLFDRRRLILLSNEGHLRYITAGYRPSVDSQPLFASASLQAVYQWLNFVNYDMEINALGRFSTNGIGVNNSFIYTVTLEAAEDRMTHVKLIIYKFNGEFLSRQASLFDFVTESCQVAGYDYDNPKLLAYCCKQQTTNAVICQYSGRQANYYSFDDFLLGYDFIRQKVTLILFANNRHNVYAYIEGESTAQTVLPIDNNAGRVIAANIVAYNSILIAVKAENHTYASFYACAAKDGDGGNFTCRQLSTRINLWAPVSDNDQLTYSVDFIDSKRDEDQINLIGLHSAPLDSYLTIETVAGETLTVMIGKSNPSFYLKACFHLLIQSLTATSFCCVDQYICGATQFALNNNGSQLIVGHVPHDQDDFLEDDGHQTTMTDATQWSTQTTSKTDTTTLTIRIDASSTTNAISISSNETPTSPVEMHLSVFFKVVAIVVVLTSIASVLYFVAKHYRRIGGASFRLMQPTVGMPMVEMERSVFWQTNRRTEEEESENSAHVLAPDSVSSTTTTSSI